MKKLPGQKRFWARVLLLIFAGLALFNLCALLFREFKKEPPSVDYSLPPGPLIHPAALRQDGYAVVQTVPLTRSSTGPRGILEMWRDHDLLLYTYVDQMHPETIDPFAEVDTGKFKPAVLRLLSWDDRKEMDRVTLGLRLASINGEVDLYGDGRPVFQVDQFTRTDAYRETLTQLVEIRNGRLVLLPFTLEERKYPDSRLERAWEKVPVPGGKGLELLAFSADPVQGRRDGAMRLGYTRYFFDGKSWGRKIRTVIGKRRGKDTFPDRSLFP